MPTQISTFICVWHLVLFPVPLTLVIRQYYRVALLCKAHYTRVQQGNLRLSVWLLQYNEARTRALMRIDRRDAPALDQAVTRFYRYWRGVGLVLWGGIVIAALLALRQVVSP